MEARREAVGWVEAKGFPGRKGSWQLQTVIVLVFHDFDNIKTLRFFV
jgi:hypothetical protein